MHVTDAVDWDWDDVHAWLRYGRQRGWISDTVCVTHDGMPSSGPDEDAEWEAGHDPCVYGVRLWSE